MAAVISLLVVWFIISIPVALFVGAVFTLSKQPVEADSVTNQTTEVIQDIQS